ncbi:hypothetical protein K458DRAFT_488460 [Lentithecium fluviatile CBS 122367]|uniref:Myb-like domain-containing protein n=1 Tax=Lentithecium fluviatile CBS 122367 TaxID=1168545 RepID=A0A6G1IXN6_9PLEO|nr:hypothetical protein K458DRAFT_488460 [Lentithecium fluviatile CBS 122367]
MEPPAKRLRILQSVEVDETNPDYIAAKEKQRAKLKGKFENIFTKYEALPEAMTDEIDMRTGEIVVDRGHMRRLNREYLQRLGRRGRRPGQLLDDLIRDGPDDATNDDDEESTEEDARDELAPSKSPEPRNRKRDAPKNEPILVTEAPPVHTSPSGPPTAQVDMPPPYTPASAANTSNTQAPIPNTLGPAVDWTKLVQFPQTPDGQLARSIFIEQMSHAFQQAITPILSNMFSVALGQQQQDATITQTISAAVVEEAPMPATSMSQAPLPPESSDISIAVQSSPLPVRASSPRCRRFVAKGVYVQARQKRQSSSPALLQNDISVLSNSDEQVENPDSVASERRGRTAKYIFTEEDDSYMIEQRTIFNNTWPEIKSSRAKWSEWPLNVFHSHWAKCLKSKASIVGGTEGPILETYTQMIQPQEEFRPRRSRMKEKRPLKFPASAVLRTSSPPISHHLPTPSSSEHGGAKDTAEQREDPAIEHIEDLIASGGHFDEDERDLLSLAGDDDLMENNQGGDHDTTEAIIPSIETDPPGDRDGTAKPTFTEPDISDITTKPEPLVKSPAIITSSPSRPKRKTKPIDFQVDSASEDDLDPVGTDSPSINTHKKPSKIRRPLQSHQGNPRSDLIAPTIEPDELLAPAPATPYIKRKSRTPPRNFLLATPTFHTPHSAPQPTTLHSSSVKTKATPMARSVFLKKVKQSWAISGRKATPVPKTLVKQRTFTAVKRKRGWDEEEGGGDELAI